MTINALNSGASVWMADFEDATAPTWRNIIDGQINLYDALRGQIDFIAEDGREYRVGEITPTVVVRPRGWHLCEKHIRIDSRPLSGIAGRLRAVLLPQRAASGGVRCRALLLPAEAGVTSRGPAVERRVPAGPGTARDPVRDDPGDGADRDTAGRVRDGGDPLRAAGTQLGTERRTVGLHLLLHQDLRVQRGGPRARRPLRCHHDDAVPAVVHRTAGVHRAPSGSARDRRDGRVRAGEVRAGDHPAGRGEGAGGQGTRGRRRVRRIMGGPPGFGADLRDRLRRRAGRAARPARPAAARGDGAPPTTC